MSKQTDYVNTEEYKNPILIPCINVQSRQSVFTSFTNKQNEPMFPNNDQIQEGNNLIFLKNEKQKLSSDRQQSQPSEQEQKSLQLTSCEYQSNETRAQQLKEFPTKLELKLLTESSTNYFTPRRSNQDKLLKFQSSTREREKQTHKEIQKTPKIKKSFLKKQNNPKTQHRI
ncbi:hypothetical protein ABPG73_019507 [Tetrahymena malaccensis]